MGLSPLRSVHNTGIKAGYSHSDLFTISVSSGAIPTEVCSQNSYQVGLSPLRSVHNTGIKWGYPHSGLFIILVSSGAIPTQVCSRDWSKAGLSPLISTQNPGRKSGDLCSSCLHHCMVTAPALPMPTEFCVEHSVLLYRLLVF